MYLCSGVNRRTLQRDLAELIDRGIVTKDSSDNRKTQTEVVGVKG